MGRIGTNEKELRRVQALVRVKSKELKVLGAATLLGPLCRIPRTGLSESGSLPARTLAGMPSKAVRKSIALEAY